MVLTALREWGDRWHMHEVEGPPVHTDRLPREIPARFLTQPRTGVREVFRLTQATER